MGKHQRIPGILPFGNGHNGKAIIHLHGHILETMDGDIHLMRQKGTIQFLDKKALSPYFVQGFIQNLISGGLHGDQFHLNFGMLPLYGSHNHLRLHDRQPAFPAAYPNFHHQAPPVYAGPSGLPLCAYSRSPQDQW